MTDLWTISELSAQSALALNAQAIGQKSGRVSAAPSSRTIRYYATHGLLDRPTEFRGRTALYSYRHLLQLVAIKSLQSRGRTLSDIQHALLGASDEELSKLGGIENKDSWSDGIESKETKTTKAFWKKAPRRELETEFKTTLPTVLPAIQLAEGITLLLESSDLLETDLQSIRAAAEPLVALLHQRRIVRPKP